MGRAGQWEDSLEPLTLSEDDDDTEKEEQQAFPAPLPSLPRCQGCNIEGRLEREEAARRGGHGGGVVSLAKGRQWRDKEGAAEVPRPRPEGDDGRKEAGKRRRREMASVGGSAKMSS